VKKAHEIIKELRKEFKYNQEDLAKWVNVGRSVYTRKELGQIALTADEFLTILHNLNKLGPKRTRKVSTDSLLLDILTKL